MTDETHPIVSLTDEGLSALLMQAIRLTALMGVLGSALLWWASGWRNAAMLFTGAAISAVSIFEWQRLIRLLNAKLDKQQTPRGAATAVTFFLLRLFIFAGVIYGSLKCFRGSVVALLCGLGLAVLATVWVSLRLLRD